MPTYAMAVVVVADNAGEAQRRLEAVLGPLLVGPPREIPFISDPWRVEPASRGSWVPRHEREFDTRDIVDQYPGA